MEKKVKRESKCARERKEKGETLKKRGKWENREEMKESVGIWRRGKKREWKKNEQ